MDLSSWMDRHKGHQQGRFCLVLFMLVILIEGTVVSAMAQISYVVLEASCLLFQFCLIELTFQ